MKIVSWNVNGIISRKKGLMKLLKNMKPDIFCAQEVKAKCILNIPGYDEYWFLPENMPGYSGTLILTKRMPLSYTKGIGIEEFDAEARSITLDFKDFILVNAYAPSYNTASAPERRQYRHRWDEAFRKYVSELPKPAILCGDFNVIRAPIDTYSNKFTSDEALSTLPEAEFRENFEKLLNTNFSDAFRLLNPDTEGIYSWWGPKNKDRLENRGSRLDYVLVSNNLLSYIMSVEYLSDIVGSDHCPVSIVIAPPTLYSDQKVEDLVSRWQAIDWTEMEKLLFNMQIELFQAATQQDWEVVSQLQRRIENSWPAKAMAVREVASRKSAAGVDGVRWETDEDKAVAAHTLSTRNYQPLPYLHMEIIEDSGRKRKLHILSARDQAMQMLLRYTLEPVAEATADKRSFSARKGRCQLDAHAYLQGDLESDSTLEWIVKIDIEEFYGRVIFKTLLNSIPVNSMILRKQLTAGVLKEGQLFETSQGLSLAGTLSPLLANMILDGLQTYIYDKLYPKGHADYAEGTMTRFADDIIVLARSEQTANAIFQIISDFLAERGFRPSPNKSYVVHISEGFDFTGRHYQRRGGYLQVVPSERAIKKFEHELEDYILYSKSTYKVFIQTLNEKLSYWANHYRSMDAYEVFRDIDSKVCGLVTRRMVDRHPTKKREDIWNRYFRKDGPIRVLVHPNDPALRVMRLAPLPILDYKPCKLNFNPYTDQEYSDFLKKRRAIQRRTGIYSEIWRRQNGRCFYCEAKMLHDQPVDIIERTIGKGWTVQNLIYIHTKCRYDTYTLDTDADFLEHIDLFCLLSDLIDDTPPSLSPYFGLWEFFRLCNDSIVKLTFGQIEAIVGPLGWEARAFSEFWDEDTKSEEASWRENIDLPPIKPEAPDCRISDSWIKHGYRLQKVDRAKEYAVWHRVVLGTQGLQIPPELIQDRIPDEAVQFLQETFRYVIKKYGLRAKKVQKYTKK